MTFEITEIIKRKHAYRALLAARPLAEELRMLEELRKRAISIRESRRELPGKK
jgi:hypothetical protein